MIQTRTIFQLKFQVKVYLQEKCIIIIQMSEWSNKKENDINHEKALKFILTLHQELIKSIKKSESFMESISQQKMLFLIGFLVFINRNQINQIWLEIDLVLWILIKSKALKLMRVQI